MKYIRRAGSKFRGNGGHSKLQDMPSLSLASRNRVRSLFTCLWEAGLSFVVGMSLASTVLLHFTALRDPNTNSKRNARSWGDSAPSVQSLSKQQRDVAAWTEQVRQEQQQAQFNVSHWTTDMTTWLPPTRVFKNMKPLNTTELERSMDNGWAVSLPQVQIWGLAKAGTSQLYHILAKHEQFIRYHTTEKEFCSSHYRPQPNAREFETWGEPLPEDFVMTRKERVRRIHVQNFLRDFHLDVGQDIRRRREAWREEHPAESKDDRFPLTVNGCLWLMDNAINFHYWDQRNRQQFKKPYHDDLTVFILFRDPADWLWSAWNFFVQPKVLDSPSAIAKQQFLVNHSFSWTHPDVHYRSPELFHELILSEDKTVPGEMLFELRKQGVLVPLTVLRWFPRSTKKRFKKATPRIVFLKSEDMLPHRIEEQGGLLDNLSDILGVDRGKFDPKSYKERCNVGDQKGSKCGASANLTKTTSSTASKQSKSAGTGSSYAISGGRTLLPETRNLIYLQFYKVCRWWSKELGIHYHDCLEAGQKAEDSETGTQQ